MNLLNAPTSLCLVALAAMPTLPAQHCEQEESQTLIASDGSGSESFGARLSLSGSNVLVGAYQDGEGGRGAGAAYVFRRDGGGVWGEAQKLRPGNGQRGDHFGFDVALAGDVGVVGAIGHAKGGSVYVYRDNGTTFVHEQQLFAPNPQADERFGSAVDTDGQRIVVGDVNAFVGSVNLGAVFVYRLEGGSWTLEQRIDTPDNTLRSFGASVSLSGDRLAVGATGHRTATGLTGVVYAYHFDGAAWQLEELPTPPGLVPGAQYGQQVELDATRLLTTAQRQAFVFEFDGSQWQSPVSLTPPPGSTHSFGASAALEDEWALIGDPEVAGDSLREGRANAFRRTPSGAWEFHSTLLQAAPTAQALAGVAADLDDGTAMVGANGAEGVAPLTGAALVYSLDSLRLNSNLDSVVAGDSLELTLCTGTPTAASAFAVDAVNGTPLFLLLAIQPFDVDGRATLHAVVPPGLAGLQLTFVGLGVDLTETLVFSNRLDVSFL